MRKNPLDAIRAICLSLPDTSEKLSHGAPTWWVNGRCFASFANDHHGDGRIAVWCAASDGAQEALVSSDPEHFFVPAYVGCRGWLGMRVDRKLPKPVIASMLREAHEVIASKKRASSARRR